MTKSFDFYFDFISPYSYLAYKKFLSLNNNININFQPILLGGLHNLGGITAPAFNERKMKNMKNDCKLIAFKNKIEFRWNTKFPINSLYLMRGYIAINNHNKKEFFDTCFEAYWKNDIDDFFTILAIINCYNYASLTQQEKNILKQFQAIQKQFLKNDNSMEPEPEY